MSTTPNFVSIVHRLRFGTSLKKKMRQKPKFFQKIEENTKKISESKKN